MPSALMFSEPLVHRLSQILYGCLEELGSTKAALYLAVPGSQDFHLATSYGWPRMQPPPAELGPEHPLRILLQRERRGVLGQDLAAYPPLAPFCVGSEKPRFFVTPLFDRGEWAGLLLQRDPSRGEGFQWDRHEAPTQSIGAALVEATASFAPPGAAPGPSDALAPESVAALHVPAPPTGAMIQVEEPYQPQPAGKAMERFQVSGAGQASLSPRDTQSIPIQDDQDPLEARPTEAALLPEQETFFWEAASLLCRMIPASAAALFVSDDTQTRPILTFSRLPLGPELKKQVVNSFVAHLPHLPHPEFRLVSRSEWFEREPQQGAFLTLLPVLLEEQFGDDDLLILFRLEDRPFTAHEQEFIRQVSRMLGFYLQEARLHERYHQSFLSVSHRILASAEGRLPTLQTQSVTTAELAQDLARRLQLSSAEVEAVGISAILHDVGTLLLDRRILEKPRLSAEDRAQVQTHPILASTFLKDFKFPFDILHIIRHHHESWDGQGYPDGLSGETIPLGSRIIHLVESYSVMVAGTRYKAPKSVAEALRELDQLAGRQFDPEMVPEFIQMLKSRHL